jgi:hypothetical protein
MKIPGMVIWAAALTLLGSAPGFSQSEGSQGQGRAVVTILPKQADAAPLSITEQDLSVKVNGKQASITAWTQLQSPENRLELVLLIDGSARSSLGIQFDDIAQFVKGLPPNTKAAIAYMQNGSAVFASALSADPAQVLRGLHLPGGLPGSNASPYFCLSDLAKNWPSGDRGARREVLMVTDGVDNYQRRFNPDDPYVQAAITDSVRAGLVVYSIYWRSEGRFDRSYNGSVGGQSLLSEVSEATGGNSFGSGMGSAVSFAPYLDEFARRLRNQYRLEFVTPLNGKARVASLKLKLSAPGTEVNAPELVMVFPIAPAQK